MKILIVEDDRVIARFLLRVFQEEGFAVDLCDRGDDALVQAKTVAYDAIILDWVLPEVDGLTVCRELRRTGAIPAIIMVSGRGDLKERVLALDSGADDFVSKPFEVEELVARVRAVIRRAARAGKVQIGELSLARSTRQASLEGAPLTLTAREFELLAYLVGREGRVVSRTEVLASVWGIRFDAGSNLVEVHVSRLREKLGAHATMIETIRGVGYRVRAPP